MMNDERTEQELQRRNERAALEDRGIATYAYAWPVSESSVDIRQRFESDPPEEQWHVSIAGRILTKRIMGKAAFFTIQDGAGIIQVYVRRDDLPEGVYNEVFKRLLSIGDIVGIKGFVFRTKTGETTIHAEEVQLLTKALRPMPVVKQKGDALFDEITDKEFRYRQRYVDLATNPESREVFRLRSRMISAMRSFLDDRGYLEVETPILQPVYGGATARPFTTHHNALDMTLYLRIADELYLKRLLIGGIDGVYEISKDFRNEGTSRFHNPEFTMLELYVAYKDYVWMMDLVEELIEHIAVTLHGTSELPVGEQTISFRRPWRRLSFLDSIQEATGLDLRGKSRDELADVARSLEVDVDSSMGSGKILDEIFGDLVEPHLIQPTFIMDHPIELSPLAKKHRTESGLAERFEAICNGKEICNAFSELNDPVDQRARFEDQAKLRAMGDDEAMQVDHDFLRALEYGMPPAAGLGIGVDRLAMLMTNRNSIRDVVLFPHLRPEEWEDQS